MAALKESELTADSLRRQVKQAKEDLQLAEQELETCKRRVLVEEKERGMIERKDRTRLQREMDTLERNYAELEQQRMKEIKELTE